EHLHILHHSWGGGGHPRRRTCLAARRAAHLFRARAVTRSARAPVATAVGTDTLPGVRGLSPDTGHPVSHHARWFSDRAGRDSVPRQIPEVVGLLLVGYRNSATTIAGGGPA